MKFHIHTTGCKANQWDSHVIASVLLGEGHKQVSAREAEVVVVNGCTLTGGAEKDIRRFIRRTRRENPGVFIILAGCHGQVYPENHFGADTVLGQREKFELPRFLREKGVFVTPGRSMVMEKSPATGIGSGKTRFFLKIQDGCDRFCTYCVVPLARGAPRSRPLTEIVDFMKVLNGEGVREVVLTGIEIASYRDETTGADLKELLRVLDRTPSPDRIRISSVDPAWVDDEFIRLVASSAKVARHVHLPLQSGSDRVLQKMGRPYRAAHVKGVVERLRQDMPDCGVGLDVIVGFPSEDEEAFEETYRLIEALGVSYLHVFPFSPREGTLAAAMEGGVSEAVKKERVRRLRGLDQRLRGNFAGSFVGSAVTVIPEGRVYGGSFLRGYSGNYIPVYLPFKKGLENRIIRVRIGGIMDGRVTGEPVPGTDDGQGLERPEGEVGNNVCLR